MMNDLSRFAEIDPSLVVMGPVSLDSDDVHPVAVDLTAFALYVLDRLDAAPSEPPPEPEQSPTPEPREDRVVSALMDRIDELQAQIDALTPVEATLEVTEGEPVESLADRVAALEERPLVAVSVSDTINGLLARIEALENPTTAEPEPVLAEDMETLMLRRLAELQAEIDALKGDGDAG